MPKTKKRNRVYRELDLAERLRRSAPNPEHRAEKWSGGIVYANRKKYNRKDKHKNQNYD